MSEFPNRYRHPWEPGKVHHRSVGDPDVGQCRARPWNDLSTPVLTWDIAKVSCRQCLKIAR